VIAGEGVRERDGPHRRGGMRVNGMLVTNQYSFQMVGVFAAAGYHLEGSTTLADPIALNAESRTAAAYALSLQQSILAGAQADLAANQATLADLQSAFEDAQLGVSIAQAEVSRLQSLITRCQGAFRLRQLPPGTRSPAPGTTSRARPRAPQHDLLRRPL
jgi:hypothetical protein